MSSKTAVRSDKAPANIGPYSQAIACRGMLYASGCIGLVPETMQMVGSDLESQVRQSLKNLGEVLKAAGCTYDDVVKTTVFLKRMEDFAEVNKIYSEYFSGPTPPARSCVAAAALPRDALFEIEAIASIDEENNKRQRTE
eukprot:TRINITY_DN2425_c0_g1_i1.p1 TRINITY_DN2425_c0_g1~~TRINITY_DN2425_c0_g1_i1.p1  ORF type:complete len:140 (-),score=37.25 TRINITY_DN2425_c0_g1_i1:96-515(-)